MYFSAALFLALGTLVESGSASWGLRSFDNLVAFGDRYGLTTNIFRAFTNHAIVTPMRVD